MRFSDVVLVVALAGGVAYLAHGYHRMQQRTIQDLQAQVQELQSQLEQKGSDGADQPGAQAPNTVKQVTCPACRGEGQLMYRSAADARFASDHPVMGGGGDKPYACPVCGLLGYVAFPAWPANAVICPDCHGMGKRPYSQKGQGYIGFEAAKEQNERLVSRPCMRCGARGYLVYPRPQ